jgi:hypothetical protein
MARGWESKAVADQIEEGNSARPVANSRAVSTEDRALKQKLDSLLLSKSRLLQQLENAKHAAHRQVLLKGLQAIESEIDQLSNR